MIKQIHHVGFAVADLEKSIKFYDSLGFKLEKQFTINSEGAKAAFLKLNDVSLEIWELKDDNTEFANIVKKHTALESDNAEEDLKTFLANGFTIAKPLAKGVTVKKYVYLKDSLGNSIEILEK